MKEEKEIKKRIEDLKKEIEFLKKDMKGDEDREFLTWKKIELKILKWIIEDQEGFYRKKLVTKKIENCRQQLSIKMYYQKFHKFIISYFLRK